MSELIIPKIDSDSRVVNLLSALDVEFRRVPLEEIVEGGKIRDASLILSEEEFVSLSAAATSKKCQLSELLGGVQSLLIYPFLGTRQGVEALARSVRAKFSLSLPARNAQYRVADNREVCGPFSGLKVAGVHSESDIALKVNEPASRVTSLVSGSAGNVFTKFESENLEVFVLSSNSVFDPSAMHVRNLDVRECFSGLVPLLFFLRHAKVNRPRNSFRWANWIIDDPGLRPRYGFLNMQELQRSVRQAGAAATIAFIPWNYRRTSSEIVSLFKREWPRLSICVHGCDHTGSEFSTRTFGEAWPLVQLAMARMKAMHDETALPFERVMVFPQGRFSAEAMRALRASEMLAAVNTELVDCQTGEGVRGSELLRSAIMSFGGFPLFMRRPAEAPLADFALDLLLEKPCLIVTHHQFYEQGLKPLQSAVESLSALQPDMIWTNLENGISSTYSIRETSANTRTVRLYSARTALQVNPQESISFTKGEADAECVEVYAGSMPQTFAYSKGQLEFSITPSRGEVLNLEVRSVPRQNILEPAQSAQYRLKVSARRYLTELRDNYLVPFRRAIRYQEKRAG